MTKYDKECFNCSIDCDDCPLSRDNNGKEIPCGEFETLYPLEATEIVRKWAEEHPEKTNKDALLEAIKTAFPNAPLDPTIFHFCPKQLGLIDECIKSKDIYNNDSINCFACAKQMLEAPYKA